MFSGVLGFTKLDLTKIDPKGLGGIQISEDGKTLNIYSQSKTFFYSLESLLKNKIRGVTVGFLTYLRIVGRVQPGMPVRTAFFGLYARAKWCNWLSIRYLNLVACIV